MNDIQTLDGIDITIDVHPDTPAIRNRTGPVLSALDRLASALHTLDPDWRVDVTVGTEPTITITAEPTIEETP